MRVRSLLLGICMVVVPLLAMFSHHLPPRLFVTARKTVWEPVAAWAGWKRAPAPRSSPVPAPPAARPALAVAVPPAEARLAVAVLPAAACGDSASSARRALEGRLAQLGGMAIDCQPLPGGPDMLATCRVPVDPAGQLQRVFQAADENPEVALGQLLTEVKSWQRRSLATAPPTAPAARGGTVRR